MVTDIAAVLPDQTGNIVSAVTDAQITVELEEETSYQVFVDDKEVGEMKTNLGGKLVLSVELDSTESAAVRIEKM